MADTRGIGFISWDLVFKLATLIILLFSGLSVEQVGRVAHTLTEKTEHVARTATEVQTQAREIEHAVELTQRQVKANAEVMSEHASISEQNAELLRLLRPLFQDLVQRQHDLLATLAQTHSQVAGALEFHREMQGQVDTLLTLHRQLLEQCPGPSTPPQ